MKSKESKTAKKDLSLPTGEAQIETCHLGIPITEYERDSIDESSYIHEHLTTLNFIVKEFNCKNILEIGTGPGESLMAMSENNPHAHITSVDIEYAHKAYDKLMFRMHNMYNDYPLNNVTFIKGDSAKLDMLAWWDLVLIDGGHTYAQVKKDITQVQSWVKDGGFMIFHDVTNPAWPGVRKAVEEYLEKDHTWTRYQWFNCNGLLVLRRELVD